MSMHQKMVRKKSACSLRLWSCRRVVDNLCNVWNAKTSEPDCDLVRNVHLLKSYLKLPSSFSELLMDELILRRQLHTGHLLVLLEIGLTHLRLAKDSCTLDVHELFRLLPLDKLQHLRCIEVDLLHTKVDAAAIPLAPYTPLLPKLLELHVTNHYVNDECVKQIMVHCPQLHTLNLRYCSITDFAIDHICNWGGTKGMSNNSCLQRLDVLGTEVSYHGAVKALRCLPNLRQLEFSKMLRVLSSLFISMEDVAFSGTEQCPVTIASLELRTVSLTCIRSCRGYRPHAPFAESIPKALQYIASKCPKLECLSITTDYLIPEDLLIDLVIKCERLHQLDIKFRSFRNVRPQFTSVQAALLICGKRLSKLTLCGFVTVDIPFLASVAPNLNSLSLTFNTLRDEDDEDDGGGDAPRESSLHRHQPSSTTKDSPPPSTFRNLRELWLQDVDQRTLRQILCLADKVQELFLLDLPALTDTLIYKIESHLGEVRRLAIHSCEGLTLEAVKFLLASPNSQLEELKMDETDDRSRHKLLPWIQKNNLDVQINWSH